MSNIKAMDLLAEVVATRELEREAYDLHCRIEEFINQPAAGEPEQQTAINADDFPTKKYPLGALDFDAPVAAGEPVAPKRCATIRVNRLDSGRYAPKVMRFDAGQFPDGELIDVYAAPPTAAHGGEAVRNIESAAMKLAACMDYPWEHMTEQGRKEMRKHAEKVIDAAMRAQAGEGGE